MIVFAIPLRSKNSSNNWREVEKNFNSTIHSIFNQKGSVDFKCIVACNDIPDLYENYDERLEFIKLDIPTPQSWLEMARDKFWKLLKIAVRIREILEEQKNPDKGIYVMPVDADDYLNCNIARWCEKHPNENGFVSSYGYVWKDNSRFLIKYPDMHTYCGSCNIIKMYREDLPLKFPVDENLYFDKETAGILNAKYPIRFNHNEVVDIYDKRGKKFSTLPFPSTIYVLGTGDNISSLYHKTYDNEDVKRFHPIAFIRKFYFWKYRIISSKLKKDFGVTIINEKRR